MIVCRTREDAEAALEQVHQILEGQLGLRLHPRKTRIVHITEGFEFLGFRVWRDAEGLHLQPRTRAVQRVKEKIRHLTRRSRPVRVDQIVAQLNPVITGWGRFFRIGELRRVGQRLDAGSSGGCGLFWPSAGARRTGGGIQMDSSTAGWGFALFGSFPDDLSGNMGRAVYGKSVRTVRQSGPSG